MDYTPLKGRSAVASACIVLLVVANFVFDATGLAVDLSNPETVAMWESAAIVLLLAQLVAAIAFLVWFHRAAKNLRALHPSSAFTYSPGWCVGWFFVPFANLVKPMHAMKEVWSMSTNHAAQTIIATWWGFYIASGITGNISGRIEDFESSSMVGLVSTLLSTVAAVCIVKIMNTITQQQAETFEARGKESRLQDTLKHAADIS